MNSLKNYLVTAQDFLEGYRYIEKVRDLYNKFPVLFENNWSKLFENDKTDIVKQFTKLLEQKGLYIQYERVKPKFYGKSANAMALDLDLRVYEYGKDVGKVACLKVTVFEQ